MSNSNKLFAIIGSIAVVNLIMAASRPDSRIPQMIDEVMSGWEAAVTSLLHTGTKVTNSSTALARSNAYSSSHYGFTTDNMGRVINTGKKVKK